MMQLVGVLVPPFCACRYHLQDGAPSAGGLPLELLCGEGTEAAAEPSTALPSPRPDGGGSDSAAPSVYAESEAAGSSTASGSRGHKGKGAAGLGSNNRLREEDYFGVCHTDVVKCIVVTDSGKIFTAGYVHVGGWCSCSRNRQPPPASSSHGIDGLSWLVSCASVGCSWCSSRCRPSTNTLITTLEPPSQHCDSCPCLSAGLTAASACTTRTSWTSPAKRSSE